MSIELMNLTIGAAQDQWLRGEWLNAAEAGKAAARSAQRIGDAGRRPGNKPVTMRIGESNHTYYHISWVAQKWPDGPGAQAYRRGYYAEWVAENLVRPGNEETST